MLILCLIGWPLGGCATFSSAPPSCDGLARRPLNRSLWDWESGSAAIGLHALPAFASAPIRTADSAQPTAANPPGGAAAASAAGDKRNPNRGVDLASYRSCGREG
ncbi:type IV secretion pathway protein [Methylocystis sp. IM3]|uniref:type IV secretion pathway protein n=1 Tax=unclassified Methylocystis TaxID=2625913 RepID=UPI0030FBDBCF